MHARIDADLAEQLLAQVGAILFDPRRLPGGRSVQGTETATDLAPAPSKPPGQRVASSLFSLGLAQPPLGAQGTIFVECMPARSSRSKSPASSRNREDLEHIIRAAGEVTASTSSSSLAARRSSGPFPTLRMCSSFQRKRISTASQPTASSAAEETISQARKRLAPGTSCPSSQQSVRLPRSPS